MELKTNNAKLTWKQFLGPILLSIGIFQIGYFLPNRSDISIIWVNLAFAFIGYFIILKSVKNIYKNNYYFEAILYRLILLLSFPLLSDDIYRFIWDGSQVLHGINPFSFTPKELISFKYDWVDPVLFQKMNSPNYFSIYPPINQFIFMLSAIPGKGNLLESVVIMRIIIILFDFGNIYFIRKLLIYFKKDEKLVFIYALNPLVILEFTGNLHFEAIMIFFTLWSVWLLLNNKWILSSIVLGLAVCTKLLPIIFLPLFIRYIGWKKTIYAGLICGFVVLILFLPFIHSLKLLENIVSSIQLYYGKFEFNGSVYQVLKAIGWKFLGYNPIEYTSKVLIVLTLIGFFISYLKSKNILEGIFWMMFTYCIFGAIVHPWYILILVALTPFLIWRFALVWSVLICLSYFTYRVVPYDENLWLVLVEYGLLGVFMIYEIFYSRDYTDLEDS
jgi:alpha-1,6-mannosyltransferase